MYCAVLYRAPAPVFPAVFRLLVGGDALPVLTPAESPDTSPAPTLFTPHELGIYNLFPNTQEMV